MDAKDLRTEPVLSERSSDGNTNYASSGPSFQCADKNKSYHDIGSNSLPKVDVQTTRPCAVIGPDRVVPPPQPAADPYVKHGLVEPWQFTRPPEYHKPPDYQHQLARNISPRQTFQENMPRIMVPPVRYNTTTVIEDPTFLTDKTSSVSKNITKLNMPSETKYCDVPYTVTPLTNDHKSVRNTELPVSNVDPVLARSAPHVWPHSGVNVRPPRGYAPSELYHYPEYSSCAAPRTAPMNRTHRPGQEEVLPIYPDSYYRGGNIRFEPYPTAKDRYQPPRYDYITNYANPYNPPHFPSHKYDMQKLPTSVLPSHPYPGYSQVPLKYLEKMREPLRDGYQRSPTQTNYGVQFHNQGMQPNFGPVPGNCLQNKLYAYPTDINAHADPHTKPYETNKAYMQSKHYPTPNNYFVNELPGSHHMKPQTVMPNYPAMNTHPVPPYPYYRKETLPYKNYEFPTQYKNADPLYNTQLQRISSQFSPNIISPVESNTSNDHAFSVSPEDCGYVSQSSTTSIRSTDSAMNRYRVYDPRYGQMIRGLPLASRVDSESKMISNKDKKNIDLRQFLQSWNEGDDEHGEGNANKEVVHPNNSDPRRFEVVNNQEQLYVLGLVNVPSEELDKYEHIQKVSKLPDNIKGYTSIDLLNQFEEAIESTKIINPNYSSKTPEETKPASNAHAHLPGNRPLSPLDVEAKISQSVIHKEVGCNFELRLCSPKMMNVEVASPAQNVLGERVIEKVANPLIVKSPSMMPDIEENCSIIKRQNRRRSLNREEAPNIPSCKMVKTQYSVETSTENKKSGYSIQDLESNSGVCLASLPRLDNDIELSFPEVNQQFINANKVESMVTTTRDNLPSLDIDKTELQCSKQSSEKKDANACPFSPSEEFPKLSKYRKLKINKESTDPTVQAPAQPVRTDSVIIKNPENSENISMAEDKVDKLDQFNERLAPTPRPINLAMHSPISSDTTDLCDAVKVKSSTDTLNSRQIFNTETSPENIIPDTNIAKDTRHTEDLATDLTSSKKDLATNESIKMLDETKSSLDIALNRRSLKENDSGCNVFTMNDYKLEDDDEVLSVEQERRRQSLSLEAQLTPMSEDTFSDDSETESDDGGYKDGNKTNTALPDDIKKAENIFDLGETKKKSEVIDRKDEDSFQDQTKDNANIEELDTTKEKKLRSTNKDNLPDASDSKYDSEKTELDEAENCNTLSVSIKPDTFNEMYQKSSALCESGMLTSKIAEESMSDNLSKSKIKLKPETLNYICQKSSKLIESSQTFNMSTSKKVELKKNYESVSDNLSDFEIKFKPETCNEIGQISSDFMESELTPEVSDSIPNVKNTEHLSYDRQSDDSDSDSLSDSETSSSESTSEAEQFSSPDNDDIRDLVDKTSEYLLKADNSKIALDSPASLELKSTNSISDQFSSSPNRIEEHQRVATKIDEILDKVVSFESDKCSSQEKREKTEHASNVDFEDDSTKACGRNSSRINSSEKTYIVGTKFSHSEDDSAPKEIVEEYFSDGKDHLSNSSALEKSLKIQTCEDNCEIAMDVSTNSSTESIVDKCNYTSYGACRRKSVFFHKELFCAVFQHLILEEGFCASMSEYKPAWKICTRKSNTDKADIFEPKEPDQKSPTDLVEENLERIHASDTSVQDSSDETEEHNSKMDLNESDSVNEISCDKPKTCSDSVFFCNVVKQEVMRIESSNNEDLISSLSEEPHHNDVKLKHSENKFVSERASCKPTINSTFLNLPNNRVKQDFDSEKSESKIQSNMADVTQNKDDDFFESSSTCPPDNISVQTDNISQEETYERCHSKSELHSDSKNLTRCEDKGILESSYKFEDINMLASLPNNLQEEPSNNCQPEVEFQIVDNDNGNATQSKVAIIYESSGSHQPDEISTPPNLTNNFEKDVSRVYDNCQPEPEPHDDIDSGTHLEDEDVFEESVSYEAEHGAVPPLLTNNSPEESCDSCQTERKTRELSCKKKSLHKVQCDQLPHFDLKNPRYYRRTTKRSLSESAIYSNSHNLDKENMKIEERCWSKRQKVAETNENINSPFLTPENLSSLIQSRRNSVSSFYHDENVSFCILIDNDCIIAQEEFDQEAICFSDIPEENFGTVVDNHILASNDVNEDPIPTTTLDQNIMHEVIVPLSPEIVDEKTVEESWVEDVACMETVISEDIVEDCNDMYEGMAVTSPNYDDATGDSDKSDLDMFSTNDHADKIKHIYGNEMCSSQSINLVKTLYTMPQMDVNKTLHHTESLVLESTNEIDPADTVNSPLVIYDDESRCDNKINRTDTCPNDEPLDSVQEVEHNSCLDDISVSENDTEILKQGENFHDIKELAITAASKSPDLFSKTQDSSVAQLSESSNDEVFYPKEMDDRPAYKGSSSSPEVSSTTEEKKSGILLKITNFNGSRISHINNVDVDSKRRIRCKFTEENDYRSNLTSSRPLITKAAQKYIPPLKETTTNDLKVKLFLPEHSLLKLKQIKMSKEQPKMDVQKQNHAKTNFKINKTETNKKPKPKFEDVLKSIDEIQIKMHKEKSKKIDKAVPKVIIKKNGYGSHYASSTAREAFNPDMTGRKWQPWVFLEKHKFIDKMAFSGKTRAVYCHRKKTYILAEHFKKYKSIGSTKFFISQPKSDSNPAGPLKYTIKLKQVYEA